MSDMAPTLDRSLGTLHLWGICVGLVISGEYFGWSYGWASAGTLGFLWSTGFVTAMYAALIFSFTELATAIPSAGGPFAYSLRAFGPLSGRVAGVATLIEFLFASPAVALAIGAYLGVQFPDLDPKLAAVALYAVFAVINIVGVKTSATLLLAVTVIAIGELLVFMGVMAPSFSWSHFVAHGWGPTAGGQPSFEGILKSLPFAIWFYLGLEGAAMAAEEVRDPARTTKIAFIGAIATLVALALGVMLFAGGAGDWRLLSNINDPLPQAMRRVVGSSSGWLKMLVWLGLFGLIASFHGNIIGYSRQIFAMARAGYLPAMLGRVHSRFRTPHLGILAGSVVGVAAIFSDSLVTIEGQSLTASIVTLSVFGALTVYVLSMASLIGLRRSAPDLERPFRTPGYPFVPVFALGSAATTLAVLAYYNQTVFRIFLMLLAGGALATRGKSPPPVTAD